jgi:hypothetical protein
MAACAFSLIPGHSTDSNPANPLPGGIYRHGMHNPVQPWRHFHDKQGQCFVAGSAALQVSWRHVLSD